MLRPVLAGVFVDAVAADAPGAGPDCTLPALSRKRRRVTVGSSALAGVDSERAVEILERVDVDT